MEWFESGGVMMWPMSAVLLGVIYLVARAAVQIGRRVDDGRLNGTLTGIIFWGTMGSILGLLGTAVGVVQMADAVERTGSVSAATLWGGMGVSLITLIFGLVILLVAAVCWFLLRVWCGPREEAPNPGLG